MKRMNFPVLILGMIALIPSLIFAEQPGKGYDFEGNGKRMFACDQPVYQRVELPTTAWQGVEAAQIAAGHELKRNHKEWRNKNQIFKDKDLRQTLLWLQQGANIDQAISTTLIHGEDGCTNTHFTGYFTPLLEVKSKPDKHFRFPLYRLPDVWPNGKKLTRRQIEEENGLKGQNLELAYSTSLMDNYFAHVQGSVRVSHLDTGEKATLAYGGKNGFPYTSIGRYLVENDYILAKEISLDSIRHFFSIHPDKLLPFLSINDSYTFFRSVKDGPFASSGAQVTALTTAAVDPKYIPHGAVLLAEIPQINKAGYFLGYQWRLLVAQDSGAAIKGPRHVDIYMGTGEIAKEKASALHHYGRLYWLQVGI